MPYQLDNNEIKLILPLFDMQGSQALTQTSWQQLLNLRLSLTEALSLDVSDTPIILDEFSHKTDESTVCNVHYVYI